MEKDEKIENKIKDILQNELSGEITSIINKVGYENLEIETQNLNYIYNNAKNKIMEMLIDEYRLSEYEVIEFVEQTINSNKDYVERIIAKSREDKNMNDIYYTSNVTKHVVEEIEFNEEEMADQLNEFYNNASNKLNEIINEDETKSNVLYQIDDVTTQETILEFEKWINMKTQGDDEVSYRVKNILNTLKEELINEYLESSQKIQGECGQNINDKMEEAINMCCKVLNEKTLEIKDEKTQDVINNEEKEEIVDRIMDNRKAFEDRNKELEELENESKKISAADYFK